MVNRSRIFQKHAKDLVLNPKQSDSLKEELTAFEKLFADAALDLGSDSGGTGGQRDPSPLCPSSSTAECTQPRLPSHVSPHTGEGAPQAVRAAVLPLERRAIPPSYTMPAAAACPRSSAPRCTAQVLISPRPCGNRTCQGSRDVGCPLPLPAAAAPGTVPARSTDQHPCGVHPAGPRLPAGVLRREIAPSRNHGKGAALPPP